MKLADYLEQEAVSDAEFARLIGVKRQAVHRYRKGARFPDRRVLSKIHEVTNGRVTANDFVFAGDPPA